jgi:hypothetical protein
LPATLHPPRAVVRPTPAALDAPNRAKPSALTVSGSATAQPPKADNSPQHIHAPPPRCHPMIQLAQGNLLEARTEALVNAVNTVGVM